MEVKRDGNCALFVSLDGRYPAGDQLVIPCKQLLLLEYLVPDAHTYQLQSSPWQSLFSRLCRSLVLS